MKVTASPAAAALVALLLASAPVPAQPGGHATSGAARPSSGRMTATTALPRGNALTAVLPDTTLARVFFAKGTEDIGVQSVRVAALQLGQIPDSLTPKSVAEVLGLLVQQAVLTHRVRQEPRHWTASDSASYQALEDGMTLSAALDSAIAEMGFAIAGRGDSVPDKNTLGIMVRDSTVARLAPVFDEGAVAMLAAAFAARPKPASNATTMENLRMSARVPSVSREDSARTMATSRFGTVTVGQVLADLGRISMLRRPLINSADDVRALVRNAIYESALRDAARRQRLAERPRNAAQLAHRAEFLDLQRFVARNVYDLVPVDSVTLRRQFLKNRALYRTPPTAVVVQTVFDSLAQADTLAHRLTVPGFAESLATQSASAGVPFQATIQEQADTALFGRMRRAGEGAVLGPDPVRGGWRVLKVMSLVERSDPPFEKVRDAVLKDWREFDGERRMRALMKKLMASTIVTTNEKSPYLTGRKRLPR